MNDEEPRFKVIEGQFGKRAPTDLAATLRAMADAADRGEITSLVAAYVENDQFTFTYSASLVDCLTLSTLLQHQSIERLKTGDAGAGS